MAKPDDKTVVAPAPKAMAPEPTAPLERTVIVAPIDAEPTIDRVETTEKVLNPFAADPGWEAERAQPEQSVGLDAPARRSAGGASKWKAGSAPTTPPRTPDTQRVSIRPPTQPPPPSPAAAVGAPAHDLRTTQDAWKSAWAATWALLKTWFYQAWQLLLRHGLPVWRKAMSAADQALKKVESHADNLERRAIQTTTDDKRRTVDIEAKSADTADRARAREWNNFGKGKTTSYLKDDDKPR